MEKTVLHKKNSIYQGVIRISKLFKLSSLDSSSTGSDAGVSLIEQRRTPSVSDDPSGLYVDFKMGWGCRVHRSGRVGIISQLRLAVIRIGARLGAALLATIATVGLHMLG